MGKHVRFTKKWTYFKFWYSSGAREKILKALTRKTDVTITHPINKCMEIQGCDGHLQT